MFYDNVYRVCREKGTTPTAMLKDLGFSTGNVSKWKSGSVPNLDLACAIAKYLSVSLDYLADPDAADITHVRAYDDSFAEWAEIIERIPEERHQMCKDFLRTHMVIPEKYAQGKIG